MHYDICGIIFKVSYPSMGDTAQIQILGKSMLDWVRLSLADSFYAAVDYDPEIPVPHLLKPYIIPSDYTVVLFSDTPLITRKTVLDAVYELDNSDEQLIKLTRGFVFRTKYLLNIENIVGGQHRFFDEEDFLTAFSFKQAAMVTEVLKNRIISYHMSQGVQFDDPNTAYISCDAVLEKNVKIGSNTTIKGKTLVKAGTILESGCLLDTCVIEKDAVIKNSYIERSLIGEGAKIGPYANIRPGTKIGKNCKIGNFVEIKNSTLEDGVKVSHLSYIGDASIGVGTNIGAGTIFCNYDGKVKHRTTIGRGAFIGSNTSLVAPLKIGDNAVIAAGSVITENVPNRALGIGRSRQTNKNDYKK
ncbi:MAG: hypothetical protein FWE03_02535 [Firmicutes bacterium]|nr:hypothetical protein [Bacillota bacterium]